MNNDHKNCVYFLNNSYRLPKGPKQLKQLKLFFINPEGIRGINFRYFFIHFFRCGGVSAGYMYSARQKIKNEDDKNKTHDDFDLERWKLAYIGELNLGPIKLYGSYAMNSMWDKGLEQTPYNVGIRFSHW